MQIGKERVLFSLNFFILIVGQKRHHMTIRIFFYPDNGAAFCHIRGFDNTKSCASYILAWRREAATRYTAILKAELAMKALT